MMTGHAGIFAGGDMVPSERTVTVAVGHGKKAARHIDAWLRGEHYEKPLQHEVVGFDKLNLWYFTDAAQRAQAHLQSERARAASRKWSRGLAKSRPCSRHSAACPAATASSATAASAPARKTP